MTARFRGPLAALMLLSLLGACADASMDFPVTKQAQKALPDNVTVVPLHHGNIAPLGRQYGNGHTPTRLPAYVPGEYRIGPGDIISIYVLGNPDLSAPATTDEAASGYLVNADGTVTFPFAGAVPAAGKTIGEFRDALTAQVAEFYPDPQVDVRITDFNAQRVVIGGAVQRPVTENIGTVPLTLLEAVNAAGGFAEDADPRAITVRRNGQSYRVDLEAFLSGGMAGNNPYLRAGDVVSVPRRTLREAYVLGEVVDPATVDLSKDPVTLTQALARQGGLEELRADARGVFVFRFTGEGQITVYQLDTVTPAALLLGTRFALWPGDVVYVTKSPLQRWNDTISRILPTVTVAETARDF